MSFDEYDTDKLKKARKLLNEVYEYNYSPSDASTKKLATIIKKLDALIVDKT